MQITKVTETTSYDNEDYRVFLSIEVDWLKQISFRDWESEDANISRDFNDVHAIYPLLKRFYELWRSWTEVEFSRAGIEWDDSF